MDINSLRYAARDKVDDWGLRLTKAQLSVVSLLVIALVVGLIIVNGRGAPAKVVSLKAPAGKKETATVEMVVVHVAGAVARPGVYRLPKGSRVNDAILAAGSSLPEADQGALNLAAKLLDGQRVYLPVKGQAPAVQGAEDGSSQASSLINLNTAGALDLDKLPGVGEVLAKRIVDYRMANGGFKRIEELQRVEGIGAKKFGDLKDKVTVE
ncbi:MAG: helix-hairpin-helix domain-containing protein [Chloroflexi bacterium]|nr:helix-hairpin-helix domain-containing protein [Chloroflexota bacterium]